ncbi:SEC-C motif domain protein [Syntrophobacter sp. SbD1]|nr:SEC-C motif domain protein [Syntrophobacter sp. SbD1]
MEENSNAPGKSPFNPLQPVHELIQGGDPDLICIKYGISKPQLDKMLSAYQTSRREAAVAGAFTASKTNRNDPCPCGSGKKYKKCCLSGHEEARKLIPNEQMQQIEGRVKAKEQLEKEIRKGFELIFSQEYERAEKYAGKQIETFPEDDRFYDIRLSACFALGDYEGAFRIARKRWQTAVEEKLFFQENGYHKREGMNREAHVHFYSPSTWLEKFWIAQRARTWREQYPVCGGSPFSARGDFASAQPGCGGSPLVEKLQAANDLKRFPEKQEEGFEARKLALAPVLESLESAGKGSIPFLLPITYNFNWASLFVPGLLAAWGDDECLRLLAELSMFRYPYFSQKCLALLEETGERAIPVISLVMEENGAFDELKAGLLNVLGNVVCKGSFEILVKFTEHENRYLTAWACEALARHKNSDALAFLENARQRMGPLNQIAAAIEEMKPGI